MEVEPPMQSLASTLDASQPTSEPHLAPHDAGPVLETPGSIQNSAVKVAASQTPKVKRPVGRPRKDGLPAGSVPGARKAPKTGKPMGRPRKSAPAAVGNGQQLGSSSFTVMTPYAAPPQTYPSTSPTRQWQAMYAPMSQFSSPYGVPPGGGLGPDEWMTLIHTDGNAFLRDLLSGLAAQSPMYITGLPIEEAFKSQISALNTKNGEENLGIPVLYSSTKTFWLPSSSAYFSLTSAGSARVPSEHRFFYWDPLPLVFNGISCPSCSTELINKGRIRSAPVKVYDLGKPFYIIGCEYQCKSPVCTNNGANDARKFASTDTSILRILPIALQSEFPAQLLQSAPETNNGDLGSGPNVWNWQALGVSVALYTLVKSCMYAGMPKGLILEVLRGIRDALPEFPAGGRQEEEEEEEEEENVEGATGGEAEEDNAQREADGTEEDQGQADGQTVASDSSATARPSGGLFSAWRAPIPGYRSGSATGGVGGPGSDAGTPDQQQAPSETATNPFASTLSTPTTEQPVFSNPVVNPAFSQPQPSYSYATLTPQSLKRPYSAMQEDHASAPYNSPYNNNGLSAAVAPFNADGPDGANAEIMSKRRPRHCLKCGSAECKGKGGRTLCTNACQDCGSMECPGRRRPHKTCVESGWP